MEKKTRDQFRELLLETRKRLSGDYEKAKEASSEEFGMEMPDVNDEATRTISRRIIMSIGDKSLETLQQIEDALERMDRGEYGVCEECGANIPVGRLELLPYTAFCVQCQEDIEKS